VYKVCQLLLQCLILFYDAMSGIKNLDEELSNSNHLPYFGKQASNSSMTPVAPWKRLGGD